MGKCFRQVPLVGIRTSGQSKMAKIYWVVSEGVDERCLRSADTARCILISVVPPALLAGHYAQTKTQGLLGGVETLCSRGQETGWICYTRAIQPRIIKGT
jgi:hypothetical protein